MERPQSSKFRSVQDSNGPGYKRQRLKRWPKSDVVIVTVQYIPSVDSSLSTTRVRQRLCDLMGTDVIRLNDKRYFQKLTERLQEEYETAMDKQEEARAASEDARMRRLMLEGVIDAPTDYRTVVQSPGKHSKKKKKRKIKRHATNHVPDVSKVSDDESHSKSRKEDVVTQVEMLSGPRKSPDITEDEKSKSRETRKHSVKKVTIEDKENEDTSQKLNEDDRDTNDGDYDTQSLPDRHYIRKPSKYSKQEPERISKLREAQTVDGLYSIAEELVAPLGASDQTTRKVTPQKPKQKKMTVSYSKF